MYLHVYKQVFSEQKYLYTSINTKYCCEAIEMLSTLKLFYQLAVGYRRDNGVTDVLGLRWRLVS